MLPPQGDPTWLAALRGREEAGRVRYIGVQVIATSVLTAARVESCARAVDFIASTTTSAIAPRVEDTILRSRRSGRSAGWRSSLRQQRRSQLRAVGSNLFGRVGTTPLPEWAGRFDAKTWAQFFLKVRHQPPGQYRWPVWGRPRRRTMLDDIGAASAALPERGDAKTHGEQWSTRLPPACSVAPPRGFQGPAGADRAVRGGPRRCAGGLQDGGRNHSDRPPLRTMFDSERDQAGDS
jgi:hypothetical protein